MPSLTTHRVPPTTVDLPREGRLPRILGQPMGLRAVVLLVTAWALVWFAVMWPSAGYSWRFFSLGARAVSDFGSACGGWLVYACHPDLQFGPLTLLASAGLDLLPGVLVRPVAMLLMLLTGVGILATVAQARRAYTGRPVPLPALAVVGLLLMPVWALLAVHYAHLDDVLALAALVLAVWAFTRARPLVAVMALAASASAKPWAIGFAVLLLLIPSARRSRYLLAYLAVVVGAWMPFLVADPGTVRVAQFTIAVAPDSALRALGVTDAATPAWDRPAQLLLAVVVGLLLVRWGRWTWAPLAVVAARMMLDPQTYGYYSAGLLVAAVIADLVGPTAAGRTLRVVPWWTIGCALWVLADLTPLLDHAGRAWLRLLFMASLLLAMLLTAVVAMGRRHWSWSEPISDGVCSIRTACRRRGSRPSRVAMVGAI